MPYALLLRCAVSIDFRLANSDDHQATYTVFTEATGELLRRHNLPFERAAEIPPRFLAFRRYAHSHHGGSYWIAEDANRVVGFGIGIRNRGLWYLAALHVIPEYQSQGIGQRLLELTLSSARHPDAVCVIADAIQPVSNAIYIRANMLPWVPLFEWQGPISNSVAAPPADASFGVAADPERLGPIDQKVLGIQRPREHQLWLGQPGLECGILSNNGEPVGYVYVSDNGAIGPAAAISEPLMKSLVLWAVSRLKHRGIDNLQLKIPGQSPSVQSVVRSLRLKVQAPAQVLLSSRPLWPQGHYLISAGDALL